MRGKPSLQQQLQQKSGISSVVLLPPHLTGADLRCIADPRLVPQPRQHLYEPLTIPRGFHADQCRCRNLPVNLLGFSGRMHQFGFPGLSRGRVHPTNLLPSRVKITSNKHHRRLLSFPVLRSSNQSILGSRMEPSLLSNHPLVFKGAFSYHNRFSRLKPEMAIRRESPPACSRRISTRGQSVR